MWALARLYHPKLVDVEEEPTSYEDMLTNMVHGPLASCQRQLDVGCLLGAVTADMKKEVRRFKQ